MVSSPSGYDPIAEPAAARARRDLVLRRMLEQHYLTEQQYDAAVAEPLPTRDDIQPPSETSEYPYFTTWVRQQVVDKVGAGQRLRGRADRQDDDRLRAPAGGPERGHPVAGPEPGTNGAPAAAMVALDNRTSEVLAMVGGNNDAFDEHPFNLATQGQRQPGSSFKPFILAEALQKGYGPGSTFTSRKKDFCVTRRKGAASSTSSSTTTTTPIPG